MSLYRNHDLVTQYNPQIEWCVQVHVGTIFFLPHNSWTRSLCLLTAVMSEDNDVITESCLFSIQCHLRAQRSWPSTTCSPPCLVFKFIQNCSECRIYAEFT